MYRSAFALVSVLLAASLPANDAFAQALEGRLKTIVGNKTIKIAYRADATPFSFLNNSRQPVGYTVDICKSVVGSLQRQFKVQEIKIEWVPVNAQTRFDAVASGKADMECGSSTVTLGRMKVVDFSSFVFVETTGVMVKATTGANSFGDLAGKKVAVIAGTTNAKAVAARSQQLRIPVTLVEVKTREEAVAAVESGNADAFASDTLMLVGTPFKDPKSIRLLPDDLSIEPYAIALPRGDWALRLAVNTALSQIFRSGEIAIIYSNWFAPLGMQPGAVLRTVFTLGALPE
jgi:ABC-type amino acid transport substrate-binding protein